MGRLKIFYSFAVLFILSFGLDQLAFAQEIGDKQSGVASWYGAKYHGRRTSSGEVFNRHKLTAAHNGLPLGTVVKVTNLLNNESVLVKINDRGPFRGSRVIDLSEAAAREIDFRNAGLTNVAVEVVELPEAFLAQREAALTAEKAAQALAKAVEPVAVPANTATSAIPAPSLTPAFAVQVGSFGDLENAEAQLQRLQLIYQRMPVSLVEEVVNGQKVHRILAGRYMSRVVAEQAQQDLAKRGFNALVREAAEPVLMAIHTR